MSLITFNKQFDQSIKGMIIRWIQFEQISDVFQHQIRIRRVVALNKRQYIATFHISTDNTVTAMHTGSHLDFSARGHCILAGNSMLLEFLS